MVGPMVSREQLSMPNVTQLDSCPQFREILYAYIRFAAVGSPGSYCVAVPAKVRSSMPIGAFPTSLE